MAGASPTKDTNGVTELTHHNLKHFNAAKR
jgi:hypothetical protein